MAAALLSGCAQRAHSEPPASSTFVKKVQTESTEVTEPEPVAGETFYHSRQIALVPPELPEHAGEKTVYQSVSEPAIVGNRVLVPIYYSFGDTPWGADTVNENIWAIYDLDGKCVGRLGVDGIPQDACFTEDSNGNIVAAYTRYDEVDECWDLSAYLVRFDTQGNVITEPKLIMRGDECSTVGVATSSQFGTIVAMNNFLLQLDQNWEILKGTHLDTTKVVRGILEEDGAYYLQVIIRSDTIAETGTLHRILISDNGLFYTEPVQKNADSLSGMKLYQNDSRLYSATRNALGKLDLTTGEFSRLLDWNQTDIDRSVLLYGVIKVISEGELSQTVTMLPKQDQSPLGSHAAVQPSEAPDVDDPQIAVPDAPRDADTEQEDYIEETSVSQTSSSEDVSETSATVPDDSKTEICIASVRATNNGSEAYLVKVEPSSQNPHADQDVIWVGGVGITDSVLMKSIADYNRNTSNDLWIKVYDYADFRYNEFYSESDIYEKKALENLVTQVESGTGPDVIFYKGDTGILDNSRNLTDLNAYIDGASGIDRSKYFDSAFRAFETNGKLYQIPLEFQVSALIGNRTYVDGKTEMNYHDFSSSSAFMTDEVQVFKGFSTDMLLNMLVEGETATWINYAENKVSIDHNSLIELLELLRFSVYNNGCSYYGENEPTEQALDPFAFDCIGYVYSGQAAFCPGSVNSLSDYAMCDILYDNSAWYGYPGSSGCTPIIDAPITAGIAAYSTQKENAWEVIKYLLDTNAQRMLGSLGSYEDHSRNAIPVNIEAFRDTSQLDDLSSPVFVYVYGIDGDTYQLQLDDGKTMLDRYEEMLKQPFRRYIRDENVLAIVRDVASRYLASEITVTEAADEIERRIKTLIEG